MAKNISVRAGRAWGIGLTAALALLPGAQAWAAASAGEAVVNTAAVGYDMEGASGAATSNTATVTVAEVLDLTLQGGSAGAVWRADKGGMGFAAGFVLTNTGNGDEAFQVEAATPGQAASSLAIDVDGNGIYDPSVDTDLSGQPTPILAPGTRLDLLLRLGTLPIGDGAAAITARAVTGSGTPGTTYSARGDRGSDAIVGLTRAEATLAIPYQPGTAGPVAQLVKSQTVRAADGGVMPVPGATITYRLALTIAGTTALSDAEIVDPIPAGTAFVPGSIRIEDVAASDVADADAAFFDGQAIHIAMGEISQPTTRVVTFQVTIL